MVLILAYRAMLSKRTILLGIAEVLNLREYGQTLSQAGPSPSCAIILLTGLHLRFRDTRSPVPMFIAIILDFTIVIIKHNHIRHQMVLSFSYQIHNLQGGEGLIWATPKRKGVFLGFRPLCQNPEDMSNDNKKLVTLEIWAHFYTRWLITAVGVWNRLWLWSLQPVQTLNAQNLPQTRKDLTLNWYLLRHPAVSIHIFGGSH